MWLWLDFCCHHLLRLMQQCVFDVSLQYRRQRYMRHNCGIELHTLLRCCYCSILYLPLLYNQSKTIYFHIEPALWAIFCCTASSNNNTITGSQPLYRYYCWFIVVCRLITFLDNNVSSHDQQCNFSATASKSNIVGERSPEEDFAPPQGKIHYFHERGEMSFSRTPLATR